MLSLKTFTSLPRNSQVNNISSGLLLAWPNPCKQLLIPRKCICRMFSEFLFLSWCCRWAAHPQPSDQYRCPLTCSYHTQQQLVLSGISALSDAGFFQGSQLLLLVLCRGWLSSGFGKQNCRSGMICCGFGSSSGLPLHRVHSSCPSAQVQPRASQDLDLVQLSHSASRHKTHGEGNSRVYFQFHEIALQQPWCCLCSQDNTTV